VQRVREVGPEQGPAPDQEGGDVPDKYWAFHLRGPEAWGVHPSEVVPQLLEETPVEDDIARVQRLRHLALRG
jgi:hypothetical protein